MTKSLWVGQGVRQDRYPGLNHLATNCGGRDPSGYNYSFFIYQVLNIFLKELFWYITDLLTQMRRLTITNLLFWVKLPMLILSSVPIFKKNVSSRNLISIKHQFMSWWRFAFNKVNDWTLNTCIFDQMCFSL